MNDDQIKSVLEAKIQRSVLWLRILSLVMAAPIAAASAIAVRHSFGTLGYWIVAASFVPALFVTLIVVPRNWTKFRRQRIHTLLGCGTRTTAQLARQSSIDHPIRWQTDGIEYRATLSGRRRPHSIEVIAMPDDDSFIAIVDDTVQWARKNQPAFKVPQARAA
ncbi:MAG: hypothetical protein QM831_25790 [Kofleriaceae bacterium]